jgi:hypothetical protein
MVDYHRPILVRQGLLKESLDVKSRVSNDNRHHTREVELTSNPSQVWKLVADM